MQDFERVNESAPAGSSSSTRLDIELTVWNFTLKRDEDELAGVVEIMRGVPAVNEGRGGAGVEEVAEEGELEEIGETAAAETEEEATEVGVSAAD